MPPRIVRNTRVTPEDAAELEARLGYPTHDPHGDPIPKADGQLASLEAIALSEQPIGHPAVIVHLEDEPPELFRQIVAAGLEPGMRIEVLDASANQLVIWDGDREHVLSPVAAGNIFVAPLPQPAAPVVRLTALEPGTQGRVVALRSQGLTRRRLLDLGDDTGRRRRARVHESLRRAHGLSGARCADRAPCRAGRPDRD